VPYALAVVVEISGDPKFGAEAVINVERDSQKKYESVQGEMLKKIGTEAARSRGHPQQQDLPLTVREGQPDWRKIPKSSLTRHGGTQLEGFASGLKKRIITSLEGSRIEPRHFHEARASRLCINSPTGAPWSPYPPKDPAARQRCHIDIRSMVRRSAVPIGLL